MRNDPRRKLIAAAVVAIIAGGILISRPSIFRVSPGSPGTLQPSVTPTASATPRPPDPTPTLSPMPTLTPTGEPTETATTSAVEVVTPENTGASQTRSVEDRTPTSTPARSDGQSEIAEAEATPEPDATEALTPTPEVVPSNTATPYNTPLPSPTPVPTTAPTGVPPTAQPTTTASPSPTSTPTASPTVTPTRTATATPTPAAAFAFQVLPTGDIQVYRFGVGQIAGNPPAGGIKLYLDGQEFRTAAGGRLNAGTLLTVTRQLPLGGNAHATVFGGGPGLVLTQTITYTTGTDFFNLKWDISAPPRADARFFYAFDSLLDGNDLGDPYYNGATGRIGVWNPALHTRFMGLEPVAPSPSAFTVGPVTGPNGWSAVDLSLLKSFVGSGTDNYLLGLQWNGRTRAGAVWSIEARLTFATPG